MTHKNPSGALQPLPALLAGGIAAALGTLFRLYVIQPTSVGEACNKAGPWTLDPWWCVPRMITIKADWLGIWGGVSLGLALITLYLLMGRKKTGNGVIQGWAMATVVTAAFGCALYHPTLSALALVIAFLVLIALRFRKTPQKPGS